MSHGDLEAIRDSLTHVNAELRATRDARRWVALNLLQDGHDATEVRQAAGVSWVTLELWVEAAAGMAVEVREEVMRHADQARQARTSAKVRRRALSGTAPDHSGDRSYRLKVEELALMKREWEETHKERCEPFTMHSSDEIDALQGLVDYW